MPPTADYKTAVKAFRGYFKRELEGLKITGKIEGCCTRQNRRTQKFFIYSHNLDLENALKYHQKLNDLGVQLMEEFVEQNEDRKGYESFWNKKNPRIISVANNGETEEDNISNDSNGYVKIADSIKTNYELREKIIEDIKKLIAMRNM